MSDILGQFINKKKAESTYVGLADGETIKILTLKEMKMLTKPGFGGEEKEVLRLVVDVETSEGIKTKFFDNGTQRFASELLDKGVKIGSSFTISRKGLQAQTRYTISDVVNK